jgi:hypothetical protein
MGESRMATRGKFGAKPMLSGIGHFPGHCLMNNSDSGVDHSPGK